MEAKFTRRGFLPEPDPATHFPAGSELSFLDELGRDLPSLLQDPGFRQYARELTIPPWRDPVTAENLPYLRLYYVRLGFLASAYINQVPLPPETVLPRNIAVPLRHVCELLQRPPILSYDGYALYNWKRFRPDGPIALGNIDTIQNFVHMYDEHWFILVHVEIEAIAADILRAIHEFQLGGDLNLSLRTMADAVWRQVAVLKRIPEKMDPNLYFKTFRPYIRFFENVVYEGVDEKPTSYRGETGAQSSIMPALVSFLKIPHRPSLLTDHLAEMRRFMPVEHRALLAEIESLPPVKPLAAKEPFNELLEAMATFREVHFGWAELYIHRHVQDPRGTGGTPYRQWLKQLIDETREFKIA
ncbi:MAG: indoleamine 2,3-dioxygenase [Gemmataceae bacterium]|nr:indoleamine 2,3-dioxygenase [Gemmataceae bacterium]